MCDLAFNYVKIAMTAWKASSLGYIGITLIDYKSVLLALCGLCTHCLPATLYSGCIVNYCE